MEKNREARKNALIIGGSGGLSGRLATMAQDEYQVWALTRGLRPLGESIQSLVTDRNDEDAFQSAVMGAGIQWDVVFDCICMKESHAQQDLRVLPQVSKRLVVISTDSVYDPAHKETPQTEETDYYVVDGSELPEGSYAGNKRKMEEVFLRYWEEEKRQAEQASLAVTLFRPGHIYGPGFLIGCYPEHSRQPELLDLIAKDMPLSLVAGGIYLTQPIFVDDLAATMLDCVNNHKTFGEIFGIGGPKAVENRIYYELIGELLGKRVTIKEIPLTGYGSDHPEFAGHLNHRIYDLSKLCATGVQCPSTPLKDGLRIYLESLGYATV